MVAARSAAEIPVEILPRASIDTVKAVPNGEVLSCDHEREPQLVAALLGEGEADEAAPVARHEVDGVGRDLLGRDREVALVLAVLVVDDDDELPGAERLDRVFDAGEEGRRRHGGVVADGRA